MNPTRWGSADLCGAAAAETARLSVDDIDLWELNEAFASQVLASAERLGISHDKLNVDGGSISIGHPYGMSGARMTGHALIGREKAGCENMRS